MNFISGEAAADQEDAVRAHRRRHLPRRQPRLERRRLGLQGPHRHHLGPLQVSVRVCNVFFSFFTLFSDKIWPYAQYTVICNTKLGPLGILA